MKMCLELRFEYSFFSKFHLILSCIEIDMLLLLFITLPLCHSTHTVHKFIYDQQQLIAIHRFWDFSLLTHILKILKIMPKNILLRQFLFLSMLCYRYPFSYSNVRREKTGQKKNIQFKINKWADRIHFKCELCVCNLLFVQLMLEIVDFSQSEQSRLASEFQNYINISFKLNQMRRIKICIGMHI